MTIFSIATVLVLHNLRNAYKQLWFLFTLLGHITWMLKGRLALIDLFHGGVTFFKNFIWSDVSAVMPTRTAASRQAVSVTLGALSRMLPSAAQA